MTKTRLTKVEIRRIILWTVLSLAIAMTVEFVNNELYGSPNSAFYLIVKSLLLGAYFPAHVFMLRSKSLGTLPEIIIVVLYVLFILYTNYEVTIYDAVPIPYVFYLLFINCFAGKFEIKDKQK